MKLSKNFKWDENPRLDQKIEMICSEHGKFITTPNKIIGNEISNILKKHEFSYYIPNHNRGVMYITNSKIN